MCHSMHQMINIITLLFDVFSVLYCCNDDDDDVCVYTNYSLHYQAHHMTEL